MIKVIIADTSFLIRKGLKVLLQENALFEFMTDVSNADDLNKALKNNSPDVLIVDHCCDDCFSLSTISKIRKRYPTTNVLVISHEKSSEEIKKVIGIGIKNYLLKDCNEQEIVDAIICCARGEKYFCKQIVDVLLEREISSNQQIEVGDITERESEIIKQFVSGKKAKDTAHALHISLNTVNTHKKNIYKKLGISNGFELAQYAFKTGLIQK